MRTSAKAVFAATLLAAVSGTALGASKTYDLDAFTAVEITSGINARIEVGPALAVRAESPRQQELDELNVEVRDGKLRAWVDWDLFDLFRFGDRRIDIFIAVPALDAAEASSGANIEVTGISGETVTLRSSSGADIDAQGVAGKSVRIEVSSGADINVEGACGSARVNVSSGATLRADKLECADVDIDASSGADASVFASASIKANASSGADIKVLGNPASVDEDESSGGRVDIGN